MHTCHDSRHEEVRNIIWQELLATSQTTAWSNRSHSSHHSSNLLQFTVRHRFTHNHTLQNGVSMCISYGCEVIWYFYIWYLIYFVTAIGLKLSGSSIVHIFTKIIHRTTQQLCLEGFLIGTQSGQTKINNELTMYKLSPNWEECGLCPVFASYTLAFALQLRKKHGKTCQGSQRVPVGMMKTEYTEQNIHKNKNT